MDKIDPKVIEMTKKNLGIQRERLDPFLSTQGNQKLWNYFLEIIKQTKFKNKILELRIKYKIPTSGYNLRGPVFYEVPEEWYQKIGYFSKDKFEKDIKILTREYGLNKDWKYLFLAILFYNRPLTPMLENAFNLCFVEDLIKKPNKYDKDFFPIALRISPYASVRDILDYVKKVYSGSILPLQNKYKRGNIKIGKFKTKKSSIQERYNFIYSLRHLPRKQISRIVGETFPGQKPTITYAEVGKIISLEKKRRKEL